MFFAIITDRLPSKGAVRYTGVSVVLIRVEVTVTPCNSCTA